MSANKREVVREEPTGIRIPIGSDLSFRSGRCWIPELNDDLSRRRPIRSDVSRINRTKPSLRNRADREWAVRSGQGKYRKDGSENRGRNYSEDRNKTQKPGEFYWAGRANCEAGRKDRRDKAGGVHLPSVYFCAQNRDAKRDCQVP